MKIAPGKASGYNLLDWAQYALSELMDDANLQQNVLMHLIGQPPVGKTSSPAAEATATRATGGPADDALDFLHPGSSTAKALTYQRITVSFTSERLQGLGLGDIDPSKVGKMDAADQIPNFQRIGQAVAKEQVKMDLLKQFFV
jgi:hypothetical protein